MSVQTATDVQIDQIREHLKDASRLLAGLIEDEPWGWDDLSKDYQHELHEILLSLFELKVKIRFL